MLSAIMNFNLPWVKTPPQSRSSDVGKKKVDPANIGKMEKDILTLNDEEIAWISKHYLLM